MALQNLCPEHSVSESVGKFHRLIWISSGMWFGTEVSRFGDPMLTFFFFCEHYKTNMDEVK